MSAKSQVWRSPPCFMFVTRHPFIESLKGAATAERVLVTSEPARPALRRTAWSAVVAGAPVALMTTFLSSLLAAGLRNPNPASGQNPLAGYGTGSVVALVATSLIALFLGGWVTGYLAGLLRRARARGRFYP